MRHTPDKTLLSREPSPGTAYVIKNAGKYGFKQRVAYLGNSLMMKRMARDRVIAHLKAVDVDIEHLVCAMDSAVAHLEAL